MLTFLFLVLTTLLLFKRAMFYSLLLVFYSAVSLFLLTLGAHINPVTALLIVLVYVGARIVSIGYICAVSPNLLLEPWYGYFAPLSVLGPPAVLGLGAPHFVVGESPLYLLDFFYAQPGVAVFIILVVMLFLTLLMVTSQYYSPRGPFRCSLS